MSTLIRCIGKCYVNRFGFDLYENDDGTAHIRPTKQGGHDLPRKYWKVFNSLESAESFIEHQDEDGLTGAGLVQKLKNGPFSDIFDD